MCRVLSPKFGVVRPHRTSLAASLQGKPGVQGVLHEFGVVQAQRTSAHLLETQQYRASKACNILSQAFRVVRPYRTSSSCLVTEATRHVVVRTFSSYTVTGNTRYARCFCTRSGWFKTQRTSVNLLNPQEYRE